MALPAVQGVRRLARRAFGADAPGGRSTATGSPGVRHRSARALPRLLAALCLCAPLLASGAPPPGGSTIRNQASASSAAGAVPSNAVLATVQAATLDVTLRVSPGSVLPGGVLSYTLDLSNGGNAPAGGTPFVVDGAPSSGVLAAVPVPPSTTFGALLSPGGGTVLYHLSGDPAGQYASAPPSDLSRVDGVAFSLPSLLPGGAGSFSFTVVVGGAASGTIDGSATAAWSTGSSLATASSAVASASVLPPGPAGGLFLEKGATASEVEVGESLGYTLTVGNRTGADLSGVVITDDLPAGFLYRSGSARLDGAPLADPSGKPGPRLSFSVGNLPNGATAVVTYRALAGPGALAGDGVNRARASAGAVASNGASHKVRVNAGVFTDRGYIVGTVFTDCNGNGVRDPGEGGIPGVRLYLEDGTFSVTDREGRYNFYGVLNRTHVLKVDGHTLPAGAAMVPLSNRNGGTGTTRFVDLWGGELHRADFAEGSCAPAVLAEAAARAARLDDPLAAQATVLSRPLSPDPAGPAPSPSSTGAASGTVDGRAVPTFRGADLPAEAPVPFAPAAAPEAAPSLPALDGKGLAVLSPQDGALLPSRQANVVVRGTAGATLRLLVNGREIPSSRVGKRSVLAEKGAEAWEYVGVELLPGGNELRAVQSDPFGNPRGEASVRVEAPGDLARIALELPGKALPADGASRLKVRVRLLDEAGRAVTVRTPLVLEAEAGQWKVPDLDPKEPGVQLFLEGGTGEYELAAPADAGDVRIRATSGKAAAEGSFYFAPDLRPLVAAGVVEGMVGVRNLDLRSLAPARDQDGFERELRGMSYGDGGKSFGGARTAFFLKGKIRGDMLLTMAYDSDKETKERLFRDIQPDEYYPVYGDGSVRGFDAQSSSRFFVRVDRNRSYGMYGDYVTMAPSETRTLGTYQRSLTGSKGHYEDRNLSVTAFASEDTSSQVVDEIPGAGVSGPYVLSRGDVIENSEKVEILVRDRYQPDLVVKRTPMTRFADYEIDRLPGRILFKAPVPSVDAALNPVSVRVVYESDQGGNPFWVGGGEGRARLSRNLEVGGTFVRDANPLERYDLSSVNAVALLRDNAVLIAEAARSEDGLAGVGEARRLELRRDGDAWSFRAYVEEADNTFHNPSSTVVPGRRDSGVKGRVRLVPGTVVRAEATRSEEIEGDGRSDRGTLAVEQPVTRHLLAEASLRHERDEGLDNAVAGGAGDRRLDTARLRLTGQLPQLPRLSLFGEYEQSLRHAGKVLAGGGEYRVGSYGRVYGRHEFASDLAGDPTLEGNGRRRALSVLGADAKYMKDGSVFSEYRVSDLSTGREVESAVGLRNGFDVGGGLRLLTTLEQVRRQGSGTDTSTAATAGLDYTGDNTLKGSTRLEFRTDEASDGWLHTAGLAKRLSREWTALARYTFDWTDNKDGRGDAWNGRLRGGLAYRAPAGGAWNALGLYEYRYERDDSSPDAEPRRIVHILSTHGNWSPRPLLALSGRYAGKAVAEEGGHSLVQMAESRATYDFAKGWDAGLAAGALWNDAFSAVQYRTGAEVGYQLFENLWLSAGFNVTGYSDRDLTSGEYTCKGGYLRMRFKFDESIVPAAVRGDEARGGEPARGRAG